MAFQLADSNDTANATDSMITTTTPAQPDFSQYILPESTLYEPLPSWSIPDIMSQPSTIELLAPGHLNGTGQPGARTYAPEDYIFQQQYTANPDYRPTAEDLNEFTWAGGFLQTNYSREQIQAIADNSSAPDGARRLADYLSSTFHNVSSATSAGDDTVVNLNDIKLIVQLAAAQSDLRKIEEGKDLLISNFDSIDTNDDNALSDTEVRRAKRNATDQTLSSALEGLSNHQAALFGGWSHLVSKDDIAHFEARTALASIARERHYKLEMPNHTFLAEIIGGAVGTAVAYYSNAKYSAPFMISGGANIGRLIASDFARDKVQKHYEQQASPAIKELLSI